MNDECEEIQDHVKSNNKQLWMNKTESHVGINPVFYERFSMHAQTIQHMQLNYRWLSSVIHNVIGQKNVITGNSNNDFNIKA
ncbi:hypothetical protein M8J76_016773 [Diaphorina citri]|nr:hypothetical protein M8J76_016773 [Diaphorina citri]